MDLVLGAADVTVRILVGHAIDQLVKLPPASIQSCVTSPPYYGLRNYDGPELIWGGNCSCDHEWGAASKRHRGGPQGASEATAGRAANSARNKTGDVSTGQFCLVCLAWRGQLGLEPTPELYVEHLVDVFRALRPALKDDGTLWLNLGDSYAASGGATRKGATPATNGLKAKDLVMIPARVALALQADGWWVRSDIIWAKSNPMPESVTDRPTKAHEYLFLFAKGQSRTRTIPFSNVEPERVHFGLNFGKQGPTVRDTTRLCGDLAVAFFYAAQLQRDFSLPPFYSEEWKQCPERGSGHLVADLPPIQRMAAHAARFLNADATTKEFLCEVHGLWCDLRDSDHLLISRALTECFDSPHALVDGNTSIAVNDTGQPSKVDFVHGLIIGTVPTTCHYFYDTQAIAEPLSSEDEIRWAGDANGVHSGESHVGQGSTRRFSKAAVRTSGNKERKHRGDYGGIEGSKANQGFAIPWNSDGSHRPQHQRALELAKQHGLTQEHIDAIRACGINDNGPGSTSQTGNGRNTERQKELAAEAKTALGGYYREFLTRPTRNARSVWTISTKPYSEAHFAVMPPELARKCILAGSRPGDTIVDPFGGAGTTGLEADRAGRDAILIEISPKYAAMSNDRIAKDAPLFHQ